MYFNVLYFKPSLCYYFSFWVFPLIIVLWSCFWYFVWKRELKCWKIWGKVSARAAVGSSQKPAQKKTTVTGFVGGLHICVCVRILDWKGLCHTRYNIMHTERAVSHHTIINTDTSYCIFAVWSDYCTVIHLNYRNGFQTKPVRPKNRLPTLRLQTIKLQEQQRCHFQESSSSNFKPKHHIIGAMPV